MRQRIRPKPDANAITSPVSRAESRRSAPRPREQGSAERKAKKITWFETAGEAAAQRPTASFHARFPVCVLTA